MMLSERDQLAHDVTFYLGLWAGAGDFHLAVLELLRTVEHALSSALAGEDGAVDAALREGLAHAKLIAQKEWAGRGKV
jgi:hypothetical protein